MVIRTFDIIFSLLGLIFFLPLLLIIWVTLLLDTGSPIYQQNRCVTRPRSLCSSFAPCLKTLLLWQVIFK